MQTKSILLSIFLAMTSMCMAQVRISTSDLNGTKWRDKHTPRGYDAYTAEKEIWYDEKGKSHPSPYYLTDTPVKSPERSAFDCSKVGKGTTGCYLVTMNEKMGTTYCYRIRYFDKEEGIMEMKLITDRIIGWHNVIVYTLIK